MKTEPSVDRANHESVICVYRRTLRRTSLSPKKMPKIKMRRQMMSKMPMMARVRSMRKIALRRTRTSSTMKTKMKMKMMMTKRLQSPIVDLLPRQRRPASAAANRSRHRASSGPGR